MFVRVDSPHDCHSRHDGIDSSRQAHEHHDRIRSQGTAFNRSFSSTTPRDWLDNPANNTWYKCKGKCIGIGICIRTRPFGLTLKVACMHSFFGNDAYLGGSIDEYAQEQGSGGHEGSHPEVTQNQWVPVGTRVGDICRIQQRKQHVPQMHQGTDGGLRGRISVS